MLLKLEKVSTECCCWHTDYSTASQLFQVHEGFITVDIVIDKVI